jgi:hypothetical protein
MLTGRRQLAHGRSRVAVIQVVISPVSRQKERTHKFMTACVPGEKVHAALQVQLNSGVKKRSR